MMNKKKTFGRANKIIILKYCIKNADNFDYSLKTNWLKQLSL